MRKPPKIVAVAVVAVALCADRALVGLPVLPPQVAQAACRIAGRFAGAFRRSVAMSPVVPVRRGLAVVRLQRVCRPASIAVHPVETPVFEYRLPPPLV